MAVKSRATLRWLSPGGTEIPDDHEDGRVAWSLARDVLRFEERETTPNPDAELIAACARFTEYHREWNRIYDAPETIHDDAECARRAEPFDAERDRMLARMAEIRALSAAGIHARASALAAHNGDFGHSFDSPHDTLTSRQLAYLLRDAAALGGAVPATLLPTSPDAALLADCAEADRLEREITPGMNGKTIEEADEAERAIEPLRTAQEPLLEGVATTRAVTIEGIRAKAATLVLWDTDILKLHREDDF